MKFRNKVALPLFCVVLVAAPFVVSAESEAELRSRLNTVQEEIDEQRALLEEKRDAVSSLEDQYDLYVQSLLVQQAEINRVETEIELVREDIAQINNAILETKEKQVRTAAALGELVRGTYTTGQLNVFEMLFSERSLSGFLSKIRAQAVVSDEVAHLSVELSEYKQDLENQRFTLQSKEAEMQDLTLELELRQEETQNRLNIVSSDLDEVDEQIAAFENYVARAEAEQQGLNAAIQSALAEKEKGTDQPVVVDDGEFLLMWPVTSRVITCEYLCDDYPFSWEHKGLDIGVPSGTPVYAAEDGFVSKTQFDGTTTTTGWVFIDHQNGHETVYMHLREIVVSPYQVVEKGQLIGYSGGGYGEPGAGTSTGPHLHFEVRTSGLPDNPMSYLP